MVRGMSLGILECLQVGFSKEKPAKESKKDWPVRGGGGTRKEEHGN